MPAVPTLEGKGMELSSMSVQSGCVPGAVKKQFKIPGGHDQGRYPVSISGLVHICTCHTHMYTAIHTCTYPYTHVHTTHTYT